MMITTVAIALVRLMLLNNVKSDPMIENLQTLFVISGLETFVAAVVAGFPSVRALIRTLQKTIRGFQVPGRPRARNPRRYRIRTSRGCGIVNHFTSLARNPVDFFLILMYPLQTIPCPLAGQIHFSRTIKSSTAQLSRPEPFITNGLEWSGPQAVRT